MRKINIKVKIAVVLLILIGVGFFMARTRDVFGSTIDTLNITRQIPNPPAPPTKPEPPSPPNPPTSSPKPSPTPGPTPSPSPTPPTSPTPPPGAGPTTPSAPSAAEGGVGGPWSCGASTPEAPKLLSVGKSGSSATLSWTSVSPITHYALSYGLSSGNYIYGVSNTGKTTSFRVSELDPATNYCFAVRAINDCAPSSLSNEICTGAVLGVGQVLGLSYTGNGNSFTDTFFLLGSLCLLLVVKSLLTQKGLI